MPILNPTFDPTAAPDTPTLVIDVTAANFEQEVLARSAEVPVLVDFWAPWCGPCKSLGPVLEKLAQEYAGGFVLAKVNTDDEMQLAGMFGIRSLPTVMLLKGGRPIDGFTGAQPESAIRELLAHHGVVPAEGGDAGPEDGVAVEDAIDPAELVQQLRAAVAAQPEQDELRLDLAVAELRAGNADEAERLIDGLPAALATDDRAERVRSQLELARAVADAPPLAALRASVAADPGNLEARHQLGVRLLLDGQPAEGLDQFLDMLRQDRDFQDGLPRKALLQAFQILDDPELVSTYRRKMASVLF